MRSWSPARASRTAKHGSPPLEAGRPGQRLGIVSKAKKGLSIGSILIPVTVDDGSVAGLVAKRVIIVY